MDAPWGPARNLGPNINTAAQDHCPLLSPDDHALIFASNRPGGLGANDFYVAYRRNSRDDFGWGPPESLGTAVNSRFDEAGPSAFEDAETGNLTLYFYSDRPGGFGLNDVYTSVLGPDGTFGPAVLVPELSTAAQDQFPTVRRDGLELFLSSNRPGGAGGFDLWVSTRASTSDPWSPPMNLGSTINSPTLDQRPAVPYSRTTLIFASDRPGGQGGTDLYVSTRAARVPRPAISAAGVVNAATSAPGPLAANSIISVYGSNLASVSAAGQLAAGRLGTNLFGVAVHIGSTAAPLLYVSSAQINAVVPSSLPAGPHDVTVTTDGGASAAQRATIGPAGPGIFVFPDRVSAVAAREDGSLVGSFMGATPARAGETIVIYGTGFGATTPMPATGEVFAGPAPIAQSAEVRIGSTTVTPDYIGGAPGFAGLYQIRLRVPALAAGNYDVIVTIAGVSSRSGVRLAVQ